MFKKKLTKTNFEFNYRLFIVLYIFIYLLACSNYQEDNRAADLNKTIMCPVCPSETIDQSQNILAVQMRSIVEEKVEQGWSDEQIKNFFIERYGASVVSTPPKSGVDLIAWIVPPAVLVITIIGLYIFLKSIKNRENLDD
ncbi:MAG: cytochrome c-type biogenesis protein CcmH [Dehalococcoidia bacterium]